MSIDPNPDRPAAVPPPMSRAAKAEALLLRFTAEAHRRKWNYDRGLDGDGVPVKSEAFDALHRLGEEMRVALEELRRTPAAVSVVPPATNQARCGVCQRVDDGSHPAVCFPPAPVDRAAVLREAADAIKALDRRKTGIAADTIKDAWEEGRDEGADLLRRLAAEAPHAETPAFEADCDSKANPKADSKPETVHACPPDGSGLTPCCGRTPFELPRTDRISSEPAAVTCAPAVVAQPGKETDRG